MTSTAVLVVALVVGCVFSAVARAAPGDLDPTFSGDGKQTTNFGPGFSEASAIVRQPDGKIVAVGAHSTVFPSRYAFALTRYNPDGSLDPSFSGDGKQTTAFEIRGGGYEGVALQPDGKIVAVGGGALARYNPNGSLDQSFSGNGQQTTGIDARAVAIQPDGKIVVVGNSNHPDSSGDVNFALARFNPGGSRDKSFAGDGVQTTNFGGNDYASAVALQANGRIVAAGTRDNVFALARYTPHGALDPTFSGDGRRTTDFGGSDGANGVAIQANGSIVAVGDATNGAFALARYTPHGALDPTFSGDGRQTTDLGGGGASAVAIRTDGKIVVVGGGGGDFGLARYDPNGSLDARFSGDGKQTTDFGSFEAANAVALQPDGSIVAGGGGDLGAFLLARYRANGSTDSSFSGDGKQMTTFAGDDFGGAVAVQADGKIVAVGGAAGSNFGVARYNPNGSLDPSFSADGMQTADFHGVGRANGVAIQADGGIVAVGTGRNGAFALARYNPNGSLDPSFSSDGMQTTCFSGRDCDAEGARGVAIQANGRIVAVGSAVGEFTVVRYKSNGSLDPRFAGDGVQMSGFGGSANAVAIQPNGKIVAVGSGSPPGSGGSGDFGLARYNPDGSPDPSFSGDGTQTTDFGGFDEATGVAIQPDGKIVAVGYAGGDFAVARYNPNGSLDSTFSGDGMQTTDFGAIDTANGVAIQANGRIVAVGAVYLGDHGVFALARYNPHGSLDSSFSGDGRQTTNFGSGGGANGVALQGGRIVAVGSGLGKDLSSDFVVARYLGGP